MRASKCLGLVGGLGVGAAVHYYRELARGCKLLGLTLDIVITNAQTARVFEYVEANDRSGLAEYINDFIRRMESAGAEVAAIPAVTPYFCEPELTATSPLPVVSMIEPIVRELARRQIERVAIFGTRFVIESELFGALRNVKIVRPQLDEIELIHATYLGLTTAGKGTPEARQTLTAVAKTLVQREHVDAILLAGTDLNLIFDGNDTGFPAIDCSALHIRAILAQLTESAK